MKKKKYVKQVVAPTFVTKESFGIIYAELNQLRIFLFFLWQHGAQQNQYINLDFVKNGTPLYIASGINAFF